jgi:hypothetical protein
MLLRMEISLPGPHDHVVSCMGAGDRASGLDIAAMDVATAGDTMNSLMPRITSQSRRLARHQAAFRGGRHFQLSFLDVNR